MARPVGPASGQGLQVARARKRLAAATRPARALFPATASAGAAAVTAQCLRRVNALKVVPVDAGVEEAVHLLAVV